MKTINVTFEDGEFEQLDELKEDLGWRDFILRIARIKKKVKLNGMENQE